MKKTKLISMVLAIFIGLSTGAFAQEQQQDSGAVKGKPQTVCPVMGGSIDKDYYVDYDGKRIYVCCDECVETVKADPEKYIKELEKEGFVLEKVGGYTQKIQNANTADTHKH